METVAQIIPNGRCGEFVAINQEDDQASDAILHGHNPVWLVNDSWAKGFSWIAGITWAGNVTTATSTQSYQSPGLTGRRLTSLKIQGSS
jgi:hypothetical protein